MTATEVYGDRTHKVAAESVTGAESPCCEECREPSGSLSEGTGRPLVRDKQSGFWYHVNCNPRFGDDMLDAQWSCLERMEE